MQTRYLLPNIIRTLSTLLALLFLPSGCDPVHSIRLENTSDRDIEILIDTRMLRMHPNALPAGTEFTYKGRQVELITLAPGNLVPIGTVVAMYQPREIDIETGFLEIRTQNGDTISLTGKGAIFNLVKKVGRLDWRIQIK